MLDFLFPLSIKVLDFNSVAKQSQLMKQIRKLTLHPRSGMNYELNHLEASAKVREVDCQVILGYHKKELVSWALFSREPSKFSFMNSAKGFRDGDGILFEIFVDPKYRRKGFGSKLLQTARKKAGATRLCICPWDDASESFYNKFSHYNHKTL